MRKIISKESLAVIFAIVFSFWASRYLAVYISLFLKDITHPSVVVFVGALLFYGLHIGLAWAIIRIFRISLKKDDLGIEKPVNGYDLPLAVAGFFAIIISSAILSAILLKIIPNFDISQKQETNIASAILLWHHILMFCSYVFLPAFCEEFLFRGILYGQLRKDNKITATIVSSLIFGAVHLQWNVAVMTFVMGVWSSVIREKVSGTIWSPILLHILKNSIAYYFLAAGTLRVLGY